MTMQEIEQDLPCGFHDASLDYFNFDIGNLILVLKFQLLIGHDEKLNRTIYKIGEFTIKHVSFFAIDPYFLFMASKNRPRPKNKWEITVFNLSNDIPKNIKIDRNLLNKSHSIANFFMGDEGIFYSMVILYETVEFQWLGEPVYYGPPPEKGNGGGGRE